MHLNTSVNGILSVQLLCYPYLSSLLWYYRITLMYGRKTLHGGSCGMAQIRLNHQKNSISNSLTNGRAGGKDLINTELLQDYLEKMNPDKFVCCSTA